MQIYRKIPKLHQREVETFIFIPNCTKLKNSQRVMCRRRPDTIKFVCKKETVRFCIESSRTLIEYFIPMANRKSHLCSTHALRLNKNKKEEKHLLIFRTRSRSFPAPHAILPGSNIRDDSQFVDVIAILFVPLIATINRAQLVNT